MSLLPRSLAAAVAPIPRPRLTTRPRAPLARAALQLPADLAHLSGVPVISAAEFSAFQALILRESGIFLSDVKRALLVGRLSRRLRELELRSFHEYFGVVSRDSAELVRMLDSVSTNETHFFREPLQFEFMADRLIPGWIAAAARGARPRRVRVWSAACSTGEEPYSVAMLLLDRLSAEGGWEIEIAATDLSTRVLERAREATWPGEKRDEIPEPYLRRFMLRGIGSQQGRIKASPELRALVRFERLNLNEAAWPLVGHFDVVLCRNVLIYFRPETRARVLGRIRERLVPGGCLFLGHAEGLTALGGGFRGIGPNAYCAVGGDA